jgi:hypothetical protein
MTDLFDPNVYASFLDRINKIKADTPAQWGKMNASQMMAHLSEAFKSAVGTDKLKRSFVGFWFGKLAKRIIKSEKDFKKGLPTAKEFKITNEREFEKEKQNLLRLLDKFSTGGPTTMSTHPHPFFGRLNPTEWNKLMTKHLDHHLKQFGV